MRMSLPARAAHLTVSTPPSPRASATATFVFRGQRSFRKQRSQPPVRTGILCIQERGAQGVCRMVSRPSCLVGLAVIPGIFAKCPHGFHLPSVFLSFQNIHLYLPHVAFLCNEENTVQGIGRAHMRNRSCCWQDPPTLPATPQPRRRPRQAQAPDRYQAEGGQGCTPSSTQISVGICCSTSNLRITRLQNNHEIFFGIGILPGKHSDLVCE